MTDFRERMLEIQRADELRRVERETSELIALAILAYPESATESHDSDAMLVRSDARAMGAVTALTHSASPNTWTSSEPFRTGRVKGWAPGAPIDSQGSYRRRNLNDPTVNEVVPVGRKERTKKLGSSESATDHGGTYQERVRTLGANSELASE